MMSRRRESGFAMLFVMLMAGIVAIMLYRALPRAAFEAERDKEQVLVDRGEQYKRAIQLYVRQNKRWPAKIEDLESTNGKRYLRKRYLDPMTGKDEWRAIHVGPTGVLTDSLVKPLKKDKGSDYNNTFITELGGVSSTPEAGAAAGNPGLRKRPSDQNPAGTGSSVGGQPPQPGNPGATPVTTNAPPQIPGFPSGAPTPYTPQPGQPNVPPGLNIPVQQGGNNAGMQQQNGGGGGISVLGGVGYSTAPGANGPTQPPQQIAQGGLATGAPAGAQGQLAGQIGANGTTPAGAASLIQGLLTTPRPGGLAGTAAGTGVGGVQGGGIAGFASKFEGEGIKVYNDQKEIQKWEFVYDMSKDAMVTGGQNALPQLPALNGQNGQNGQAAQGQTGFNTGSSFNSTGSTATPGSTTTATPTTVGH